MRKNKMISILIFILIIISISACTDSSQSNPKPDKSIQTIHKIEGFESLIFDVMSRVDLVPYYESQIKEKKQKQKNEGSTKQEEFKPKPVTESDTLLLELFRQEKKYEIEEQEKKIPDDITFIRNEINKKINELHQKWNDLKPELEKNEVSSSAVSGFDETLNSLKISGTEKMDFETLINANKLTLFMAQFIKDLDDNTLASIYTIKYYTRQIILNAVNDNYSNADNNIDIIKDKAEILKDELIKEDAKELVDKFTFSISDLENAVSLKDINIIKIKGSIMIKNINAVKEKI